MPASDLMDKFGDRQGWNTAFMLDLCLEYIDNQQDDAAFEDFLRQHEEPTEDEEENENA